MTYFIISIIILAIVLALFFDRILNVIDFRDDIKECITKAHGWKFDVETLDFLLPGFNKMLFSFKRLKIENWFSLDEINDLFKKK